MAKQQILIRCKKCGRPSLWFNSYDRIYECFNPRCRWKCTEDELSKAPDFQKGAKSHVFQGFDIPTWLVKTLESKIFWVAVATVGIAFLLTFGIIFPIYRPLNLTIGTGITIVVLISIRFVLKRFIPQYSSIAASFKTFKGRGTSYWLRSIRRSSLLRLIIIILIIAGLVAVPWTGYLLFTHQTDPITGTVIFLLAFGFLVWLIRVLNSSRNLSKKPGFKMVFFSLLGIFFICAFAGIEPTTSYKNVALDYITEQGSKISEIFRESTQKKVTVLKPEPKYEDASSAVSKVKNAVVMIEARDIRGSGIIVNQSGYIVTNSHVVGDMQTVTVTLMDVNKYNGVVVARDKFKDLAIIKITVSDLNLPTASLGDSDSLKLGEELWVIGYPLGLKGVAITKGVFSAIREIQSLRYIQTDAAVNPGNSGGALINLRGDVIGIVTWKIVDKGIEGIGFALPINDVKPFINEQLQKKQAERPTVEKGIEQSLLELEKETFRLINVERQNKGITPTIWNAALHDGARRHSESMQEKGFLYHDKGGQFAECCYGASFASPMYSSAKAIVDAWMSSTAGHREILMDRQYRQGAVGIARDKGFFTTYRCY